jgi:plasmid stabilization system protein ParE
MQVDDRVTFWVERVDGDASTLSRQLCRIFLVVTFNYPSMELVMSAVPATTPISLKLPGALKLQLEEDAKQMGMSLHAFMVSTVFQSPAAFQDLVRLETFLYESEDPLAGELLDFILDALEVLTRQPCIGRPVESGLRELIISRRRSAYLARYAWDDVLDRVIVARIRHQREVGYADEEV